VTGDHQPRVADTGKSQTEFSAGASRTGYALRALRICYQIGALTLSHPCAKKGHPGFHV